jgi:gamma-glutamylcyclotransferase (GGCT)/AIG2-like uncharacterized protein YtfP
MRDLLFVYGTLMRGFDNPMAQLLTRSADYLGPATCRGRLYRVKHYPGLVLSDADMYEACGEGFAEPTQYVRKMLAVTREDGSATEAWTYIYNWPVAQLARIESGRFAAG